MVGSFLLVHGILVYQSESFVIMTNRLLVIDSIRRSSMELLLDGIISETYTEIGRLGFDFTDIDRFVDFFFCLVGLLNRAFKVNRRPSLR
jgi:hypothetical protein